MVNSTQHIKKMDISNGKHIQKVLSMVGIGKGCMSEKFEQAGATMGHHRNPQQILLMSVGVQHV